MQFGLNFFPCVGPAEKSAERYFREAMHLCSLTDELGYTHIRQVEKGSAFIGTPADIVDMIRAFNDKVGGLDSISLHFTPADMPVEAAERSLRLFSREVLPKVAAL